MSVLGVVQRCSHAHQRGHRPVWRAWDRIVVDPPSLYRDGDARCVTCAAEAFVPPSSAPDPVRPATVALAA